MRCGTRPCGCATFVALAALVVSLVPVAPTRAGSPVPPESAKKAAGFTLYQATFSPAEYGQTPAGWRDLLAHRPSRAWAIDDGGFLRVMLKKYTGLLAYSGALAAGSSDQVADAVITTELKK